MRIPLLAPLGLPVGKRAVQEVWDTFVKPDQDAEKPQSIEMRLLMTILRAVYDALAEEIEENEHEHN